MKKMKPHRKQHIPGKLTLMDVSDNEEIQDVVGDVVPIIEYHVWRTFIEIYAVPT